MLLKCKSQGFLSLYEACRQTSKISLSFFFSCFTMHPTFHLCCLINGEKLWSRSRKRFNITLGTNKAGSNADEHHLSYFPTSTKVKAQDRKVDRLIQGKIGQVLKATAVLRLSPSCWITICQKTLLQMCYLLWFISIFILFWVLLHLCPYWCPQHPLK